MKRGDRITNCVKRGMCLLLVMCLTLTGLPVQALALLTPVNVAPVASAPFEQPQPVDYERLLAPGETDTGGTPDRTDGMDGPPASVQGDTDSTATGSDAAESVSGEDTLNEGISADSVPADSAPTDVLSSDSSSDTEPASGSSESREESAASDGTTEDGSAFEDHSVSDFVRPAPGSQAAESPSDGPDGTQDDPAGQAEESASAALRLPELSGQSDPYVEAYGEPIAVTEYTRVFAVPTAAPRRAAGRSNNGSTATRRDYTTVLSPIPNTFTAADGTEQRIDNTLILQDAGVPQYRNAANDLRLSLPAAFAPGDGLTVTLGTFSIRLIPLEGRYDRPAALENAVLYNDVFPDVDVQYTAQALQIKEDIILRAPTPRGVFRYRLETGDLQARMVENTVCLFADGDSLPTFTLLTPQMHDAAGAVSHDLHLVLEETAEGCFLTLTADESWLTDPTRVYPVTIDPTVLNTKKAATSFFTVGRSYFYQGINTASAGYAYKHWAGYPDDIDTLNFNRTFLQLPNVSSLLPATGEIDTAELVLYEYDNLSPGVTRFEVHKLKQSCTFDEVNDHSTSHWYFVTGREHEYVGAFTSALGYHRVDITETVNNWHKGVEPNYGLMILASPEVYSSAQSGGALFYMSGLSPDIPPYVEIKWHEMGDVSVRYPLDDTTVELRPINATDRSGKLEFYGVLWDGVATPDSTLRYRLNTGGYSGSALPDYNYLYPSTAAFESLFPAGATKYRRRLSNWQTAAPFVNIQYNTLYTLMAQAGKNGVDGRPATSDSFLVYKVQAFDTLTKLAAHYGVDYDQLARDNRIVDGLLVENNTLFIRNPKTTQPYSPAPLTDADKTRIDTMLVGRGLHCEFGFEPVNLNTGNFYLSAEDAVVQEAAGSFALARSYNTLMADLSGSFGRGWAFTWDESLARCADGALAYRRGDGSILYFTPDGRGGFDGPAGYGLSLTRQKTGETSKDFGTPEDPDVVTVDLYTYHITETDGTVRCFDTRGLLESVTDPQGRRTSLCYDDRQHLTGITTPAGRRFAFSADDHGLVTAVTLPDGCVLQYGYNDAGDLVSFTDALGGVTRYEYDAAHRMTAWYDLNGSCMVKNTYDGKDRVIRQLDGAGNASTLAYAANSTTATDAAGHVTVYRYDDRRRTTRIEYPDGSEERFGYNADNLLAFHQDALGRRTDYTYDAAGNLLQQTRFDGASQQYTYNAQNKPVSFTDYDGQTTQYEYSAAGDLVKTVFADGSASSISYDSLHRPVRITDALGNTSRLQYADGLLTCVTDADGGSYTFAYDAMGRVISVTDPTGGVSLTQYDAAGRVAAVRDAAGSWT